MALFGNIVNEALLNEIKANRDDDIKKAINNVLRVRISYNDKKGGKGKNERYILPVAFGLTKTGKKAVRAYQTAGSSKRGLTNPPNPRKIPKWKLFLVDNIYSWSNGSKSFKDYRDALINLGLNTHGDKGMTTLFAITPFADDDVQVAKSTQPITQEPVDKVDVTPTVKSQSPKTTDKEKFTSAANSRAGNVDKPEQTDYVDSKLNAPETKPVPKERITGGEPEQSTQQPDMSQLTAKTEPVSKDDVENGTETKDNVTSKFNDIMNRMDNLYNDKEEDED